MSPTSDELRLLGLLSGASLPSGGQHLELTVCSGHGSAKVWTDALGPFFLQRFGITLVDGSLNLRSENAIDWDSPFQTPAANMIWELCPLILAERAIGVAFRANPLEPRYLEVLSPTRLRERLDQAKDGDRFHCRLLSGSALAPAT